VRDWSEFVLERLEDLDLPPAQHHEVVAELAAHLEDLFELHRSAGLSESAAVQRALDDAGHWPRLAQDILRAKQEGNMNDRTRSLWLPGLVSLTLAMALLMILQVSGVPPRFIWMRSGPPVLFYTSWLLAQPLIGAIGAWLSRRAGGDRRACLVAGLFPSIALLGLCCVGLTVKLITDRAALQLPLFSVLTQLCFLIVLPGLALLLGTLPFLKPPILRAS
jgi:hypothetical protein